MKPAGKSWVVGGFTALAIALASALTSHYEGVRYTAYQDTGGVWTICYGHTHGVRQGDTATPAQCRAWLDADMPVAYAAVNRCITAALTVTQAAAFTDAAFNLGPKVVCGSTLQDGRCPECTAAPVSNASDANNQWDDEPYDAWRIDTRPNNSDEDYDPVGGEAYT